MSTISRELERNGRVSTKHNQDRYRPHDAHELAAARKSRASARDRKLDSAPGLDLMSKMVQLMRKHHYSVGQALLLLAKAGEVFQTCRQSVYRWMYSSTSEEAFHACKAMTRPRNYARPRTGPPSTRGHIPNMRHLTERTDLAQDRAETGHLEGDLVVGKGKQAAMTTLVDRTTRWSTCIPVASFSTAEVLGKITHWVQRQAPDAVKSITWDRGKEMSAHEQFTRQTGVPVFFAAAHAAWQQRKPQRDTKKALPERNHTTHPPSRRRPPDRILERPATTSTVRKNTEGSQRSTRRCCTSKVTAPTELDLLELQLSRG